MHEISHRVATGWRCFWSSKSLLLNRRVSVRRRLALFDSTVGSCVLYCSESWTPRTDEFRKLTTARRAMLRRIVGALRFPDEDYIQWIRRVTSKAESMASAAKVRDWTTAHGLAKWAWAGHIARRPVDTLIWRVTFWRDSQWQSFVNEFEPSTRPRRPARRRWMRFEGTLRRYCSAEGLGPWRNVATSKGVCRDLAEAFAAFVTKTGAS